MILLGFLAAAWIGALIGATALAAVQGHHLGTPRRRCCGHYVWDPATWQFVPVAPAEENEQEPSR